MTGMKGPRCPEHFCFLLVCHGHQDWGHPALPALAGEHQDEWVCSRSPDSCLLMAFLCSVESKLFLVLSLSLGLLFICLSVLVLYLLHSSLAGRRRLNPIHYHLGKESCTLQPPLSPPKAFSMNPFACIPEHVVWTGSLHAPSSGFYM